MFRSGVRELRGCSSHDARFQINKSRKLVSEVAHSFLSLYGPDEFVSGFAEPYFTDFMVVVGGLDETSGDSTLILGSILKECKRAGRRGCSGRPVHKPLQDTAGAALCGRHVRV
jgi:hypothetical protein